MTGLGLGLLLGAGLFCVWWSCWVPEPDGRPASETDLASVPLTIGQGADSDGVPTRLVGATTDGRPNFIALSFDQPSALYDGG